MGARRSDDRWYPLRQGEWVSLLGDVGHRGHTRVRKRMPGGVTGPQAATCPLFIPVPLIFCVRSTRALDLPQTPALRFRHSSQG